MTRRRPTPEGIAAAAVEIRPHMAPTPLVRSEILSRALDAEVWLKNETVTPIASFKLRGALAAVGRAMKGGGAKGATTSSTGNHGQGVAYAARLLGLPAAIFLPEKANPVKAAMIEAFGAALHKTGRDIDDAKAASRAFAERHGYYFVDDGDDADLMEGAGTVGLEIMDDLPDADAVYVPLGGGNFVAGVSVAVKARRPDCRVVAVQAKGAPTMTESFHARRPIERPCDTIADGLMQRIPPELALAVMIDHVDDAWLVGDDDLLAGMHTLAECAHALVEPAGAATLAGVWARRNEVRGKRIVLILSGANAIMNDLRRALAARPFFTIGSVAGPAA